MGVRGEGGTTTAYSFGPSYAGIGEHAWYSGNSSDSEGQKVHQWGEASERLGIA